MNKNNENNSFIFNRKYLLNNAMIILKGYKGFFNVINVLQNKLL